MSHLRSKRLLLGWLALLAPLPLPFNEVLEWPVLLVYLLAVVFFLQRADRGVRAWLPDWSLNLLGLCYFPVLIIEVRMAISTGFNDLVQALLHLVMFVMVAKLFSLRRERDKWLVTMAAFILFLGAMATSSHLSIIPYLLAFIVLSMVLLVRFAQFHVLGAMREGSEEAAERALPMRVPALLGALGVMLIAVPLFAMVPRFDQPFMLSSGGGSSLVRSTGFSDSVDLGVTSRIRSNRNVALRVQYEDPVNRPGEIRLKAAAYDLYRDRGWHRLTRWAQIIAPSAGRGYRMGRGEPTQSATIFLEPLRSQSLVLPIETLGIDLPQVQSLAVGPGGAVLLAGAPTETLSYRVRLGREPVFDRVADPYREEEVSALDVEGVTPAIANLAREVMGSEGTASERIQRLEQHLLRSYSYTTDFVGWKGESPIEEFLFTEQSGHCELFASAMVLMLRSEGIPARFVTGFLGAERNPLEGYFIVRQQNAHAWVEAFVEGTGWRVYDPTPPEGRPTALEPSLTQWFGQLYDYLLFRWDRYVLSFGADDQQSLLRLLWDSAGKGWERLREFFGGEEATPPIVAADGEEGLGRPAPPAPLVDRSTVAVLTALLGFLGLIVYLRRRLPASGAAAYRRLRRQMRRSGLEVPGSVAPLALSELAQRERPAAAASVRRIVGLYVRESFAGDSLSRDERRYLRDALHATAVQLSQRQAEA